MNTKAQYTGHLPGSGIQAHSAGDLFPAVLYRAQWDGGPMYHGVLFEGFDYGVYADYDDAATLARMILTVRTALDDWRRAGSGLDGPSHDRAVRVERELAAHLGKRAARAGVTPDQHAFDKQMAPRTLSDDRGAMPVDGMSTPIIIRMRYGYTERADSWLAFWGYNPQDFQAHGTVAPVDDGTRKLEPYNGQPSPGSAVHTHPWFI